MEREEKIKLIEKTIEKVRPYIQNDGGDVQFVKLEDDIVYVSVHGACVGCMALDYTLKEGVEALLLDEVEGIKEGDKVYFYSGSGKKFTQDGEEYRVINSSEVIVVL